MPINWPSQKAALPDACHHLMSFANEVHCNQYIHKRVRNEVKREYFPKKMTICLIYIVICSDIDAFYHSICMFFILCGDTLSC